MIASVRQWKCWGCRMTHLVYDTNWPKGALMPCGCPDCNRPVLWRCEFCKAKDAEE